jgi:hypothetical protein
MEENGGRKNGYGNAALSSKYIFRANLILNEIDCKENDVESIFKFAHYFISIEDRDAIFQYDNIIFENDDNFGAEEGLNSFYDSVVMARGISHSTNIILTDRKNFCGDISADEMKIIF